MSKRSFYITAVLVGVMLAAYFVCKDIVINKPDKVPALASESASPGNDKIFPDPENTTYNMSIYLDIDSRTLYGSTLLKTSNTSGQLLDSLWFTIYPNAFRDPEHTPAPDDAYYDGFDAGWFKIDNLKVNGYDADFSIQGVSLQVNLDQDLLPGENINVEMKWQAKVPRAAYRYGSKGGIFMLGNFYPILNVYTNEEWHTSYDAVFGDPFCFNCADYIVRLNTPDSYQVAATGNIITRVAEDNGRQTHLIQAQNARDFSMAIMYGYEEIVSGHNPAIKVYLPWGKEHLGQKVLDESADILQYYSCQLVSYPYSEFKIVFVPMKGFHGMEYSGMIFLRDDFLGPDTDCEHSQFVLAHEIAHQWWYGIVGNDQLREPWLDEGLANWSAYKYLEDVKGKKRPEKQLESKDVNLARELQEMYSRPDYYRTAYTGGESFWFALEEQLGSEKTFKVLHRYIAENKYGIADSENLLETIKKEAGKDMNGFFFEWFKTDK